MYAAVEALVFVVSRVGRSGGFRELYGADTVELVVEDGRWSSTVEHCTGDTVEGW